MFIKKYKIPVNLVFSQENGQNVPKMGDDFQEKWSKTWRSHGKVHGKSWNFESSKGYETCKQYCT